MACIVQPDLIEATMLMALTLAQTLGGLGLGEAATPASDPVAPHTQREPSRSGKHSAVEQSVMSAGRTPQSGRRPAREIEGRGKLRDTVMEGEDGVGGMGKGKAEEERRTMPQSTRETEPSRFPRAAARAEEELVEVKRTINVSRMIECCGDVMEVTINQIYY